MLPSFTLSVSAPEVLMTAAQRLAIAPTGPDGSVTCFPKPGGSYLWLGAWNASNVGGTLCLTSPDLVTAPTPAFVDATGKPAPSLRRGALQPSPDGSDFDRDYAGGGSILPVKMPDHSTVWLHSYHGEKHWEQGPAGLYAGIGLAVSRDRGKSFTKLGQVIRTQAADDGINPVTTSCGSLVQLGEQVRLYYPDTDTAGNTPQLACAAIALTDLAAAVASGTTGAWQKWQDGTFSQPSLGGRFTPLFLSLHAHWPRWPVISWNDYVDSWLLVYPAGTVGIELRQSADGLAWSEPLTVLSAADINYTGIIAPNRHTGQTFAVGYTAGLTGQMGQWQQATWQRVRVTLAR